MGFNEDLRDIVMPWFGQEVPLAIINTTDALWRDDKRPQIHNKKKTVDGWEFVFALPDGMSYREFATKEENFRDAIGDVTTKMMHVGKMAVLRVTERKIPKKIVYNFEHNADTGNMVMPILIGYDHAGPIYIDLAAVYNILIGGYIGGGKSNSIHLIINSLLHLTRSPRIAVVDFKLVEYNYLSNHALLVTDQDTARQAMARLVVEMRNRLQILTQAKCVNIEKYNEKYGGMDYIVLVIDELAELRDKQAQEDLETILRLGRAPGYRVILATQRPDCEVLGKKSFGACKANLVGRLCFQVSDSVNSKIILDSTEAASLPKIPGRAIWKYGHAIEIQTPYIDPEIAEARLYDKSPKMHEERFGNCPDNSRLGSAGHRASQHTALSILSRGAKALAAAYRGKAD